MVQATDDPRNDPRNLGDPDLLSRFFEELAGPNGCNVQGEAGQLAWRCGGGFDQSYSRAILAELGIESRRAERFLALCRDLGGHCDCEVILNASIHLLADEEEASSAV